MDIVNKRMVKGGNGNSAAETSDIIARAESWSMGASASKEAIQAEADEKPGEDDALPNPHNFSSNPGFLSTAGMLGASTPMGGGTIRGTSSMSPARGGSGTDFARGSLPQRGGPDARPASPFSSR